MNSIMTGVFRTLMLLGWLFVLHSVTESHDMLLKGDIPQMQRDIQELKLQGQKYITAEQLKEAVRLQIEELTKHPISDTDSGKHYER